MQARVVLVGAAKGVDQLIYAVAPALEGRISRGHRVVVPLRSRRVTGIVVELGEALDSGGAALKPIIELLEARPLFDAAHIGLVEFMASYYMAPIGEAFRSVVPAAARVESRKVFRIAAAPSALRAATMTESERAIIEAVGRRPMTMRELGRTGDAREVTSALGSLMNDRIVEEAQSVRGRHRAPIAARLCASDSAEVLTLRGRRQREVVALLSAAYPDAVPLEELEARMPGIRPVIRALAKRGAIELESATGGPPPPESTDGDSSSSRFADASFDLTDEQAAAVEAIAPAIVARKFQTFLLWGVTASGKTEVYLKLAAQALAAGRQVLILVPEIALADEIVRPFRERFGALVAIAHSAQNIAERWASWMAALGGQARIMIGPRSAIFAPIHDLGLVVVDEEHDTAYKNEEGIRHNARDLAVMLGRLAACPVVLGSATPSAESFFNARRGRYRMIRMARRVMERAMAEVAIIDLRAEFARRDGLKPAAGESAETAPVPLSAAIVDALRANLAAGGQSVVFLNRRGFHNFLQCRNCGVVISCGNCSVSMTFHLRDRSMRCHYCGARAAAPESCPECAGYALAGQGFGTERLASALAELIPEARIERMDSDTSGRRGARASIIESLRRGETDILVGTQMIAKGFDLPGVTLVGVVMADLGLNVPDFRSAERTFQLLTQVAGRAGRGERPGRVLIQTFAPHHYSVRAAADYDYERFMRRELRLRQELGYPPYMRMALVRLDGIDAAAVEEIADRAAASLISHLPPGDALRVLGPAPAPLERLKGRYRWQIVVKAAELAAMRALLTAMRIDIADRAAARGVHLSIDMDPVNML